MPAPAQDHTPAGGAVVEILDPRSSNDMTKLEELRADGAVDFIDLAADLTEAAGKLLPPPDGWPEADGGRWVFYPWRGKAVHLLGPASYRRLRLDRNRNKLSAAEQDHAATLRIGVVGLSVGHAVAHTLALEGLCGQLRLTDFDEIELTNLNRVPGSVFDIGVNKAVVAARRIAELDPYLEVQVHQGGAEAATIDAFLDGLDVVIEECDSFDAKVLVRDRARALGIPVIMETSDGGVLDVERFDLEPDRPLFHGLLGDFDADALAGLSTEEKAPFAVRILDGARLTARMAASALEMGRTLSAWPQLGGDVALGGATVAAAVRRIVRGEDLPSGRVRVDLDSILDDLESPVVDETVPERVPADVHAIIDGLGPRDAVLFAGLRAPSAGNTQPWRFSSDEDGVTVRLDATPTSSADVERRASAVSLGAVLHNLTAAAAAVGVYGKAGIVGDGDGVEVRVDFGDIAETGASVHPLLDRRTNRAFGDGSELDAGVVAALSSGGSAGTGVRMITDRGALAGFAAVAGAAERLRYLTPALHAEMMAEIIDPSDVHSDTGIDVDDLALLPQQAPLMVVLRRPDVMAHLNAWGAGSVLGADAQGRIMTSSALAVVTQEGRSTADYVRGGQTMQELWIRAEMMGLAVHPMNPVFLYADGRKELAQIAPDRVDEFEALAEQFEQVLGLADGEVVTTVLRLFRTDATPPASRRRSLANVLA
ncbi:Rv1355c family protein [Gordonia rubripertincta]|uniref:Rv1355c family protein n=1 Tax=Gordonia rubripertincta TaxID=36822 RepID=A0ABT4MXP7_GORRU|nr:Rv1355c family protein [Gordonia rubripertincta]MCZ4551762.1 Rv1355c family protein [Gordonia rubripertincta]